MSVDIIEADASQTSSLAHVTDTTALIRVIERVAMSPDIDISKLEKMLDMQERILGREAEQSFNASMAAAQAEMGPVSKDAENKQTRSRYATYAALDRAVRGIYTSHGFALSFNTEPTDDGYVRVVCIVSHRGGHSRKYMADMPADGLGAKGGAVMTKTHAAGSAMSYGQRYLLKLIFNVAIGEDDDDGNGANDRAHDERRMDAAPATLPDYTKEQFDKNVHAWRAAIEQGRTAEHIINMISSKYTLSAAQKSAIKSIKPHTSHTDPFAVEMDHTEQEMSHANA